MQNTPDQREIISRLAAVLADSNLPFANRLQQCLGILREVFGAGEGALHLFPDGECPILIREQELLRLQESPEDLPHGSIIQSMLSQPGPILVPDPSETTESEQTSANQMHGGRSLIAAPLFEKRGGRLLGLIHLISADNLPRFTDQELDRLDALSQWIAPFIADHFRSRETLLEEMRRDRKAASEPFFPEGQTEELEFVVHDLKSPLAALITNLDLLHSLSHSERQASLAQSALRSANKLYLRINQVLDLLRLEERAAFREDLPPVDLKEVIHKQIQEHRPLLDQKAIEIHLSGPGETLITAEESLLNHLLQNLLSNAIRHTPNQGTIAFTWWTRSDGRRSETVICLEDSGEGIEEQKKREVVNAMKHGSKTLVSSGGSGLGLFICSRIIGILQGDLWIEDNSPQGTRVCFTLPGPQETHERAPASSPETHRKG